MNLIFIKKIKGCFISMVKMVINQRFYYENGIYVMLFFMISKYSILIRA